MRNETTIRVSVKTIYYLIYYRTSQGYEKKFTISLSRNVEYPYSNFFFFFFLMIRIHYNFIVMAFRKKKFLKFILKYYHQ